MSDHVQEHQPSAMGSQPDPDDADRSAIVQTAIAILREHAFHRVSLQQVAAAAGLDMATVTALYPTLDELTVDVIDVWNGRRMQPIVPVAQQHGAVAFLRAIVAANVADPALMRLLTASVGIAATFSLPMSAALRERWIRFHALVQRALIHDIAVGREPETMEPARGAEQLIAIYEGLQLQSMVRPDMNILEAYDRAVTRLRDGWSNTYTPPVWDI